MIKRVLVAGAAGFLGSHLVDALLERHYLVVGVDNLITGTKSNLDHLATKQNFQFVKADITNPLPAAITKQQYTHIANLACPASPVDYQRIPLPTLKASSLGTEQLLILAYKNQARFTHTSTSEVYGDPEVNPQPENYWGNVNSYGERSCYDEGKRYAEALIYTYRHQQGVNTGLTRIFNTYGPRMRLTDGRVITNFISQALADQDITIYGDGSQTRSFCFVTDQIAGQVKMLESDLEGPVNIGNPAEFTIKELASKIIQLTSSKSKLVYCSLPSDDPKKRRPDIHLAQKKLAFQPQVDLATGLRQMINYMQEQKN